MIKGKKIYLDAIEEEDLEQIRMLRNSETLRKYFREIYELSSSDQRTWYKIIREHHNDVFYVIKDISSHVLLGVIGLNYINWVNRNCQLSLYIGYDNLYIDNNGWAEEALEIIQTIAFKTLGLNKIIAEIFDFDNQKKDLLINLGYFQEGVMKDQYYIDGHYADSCIYSFIRNKKEI